MSEAQTVGLEELVRNPAAVTDFYKRIGVTLVHPTLKLPGAELVVPLLRSVEGQALLKGKLEKREELIELMKSDPLHHGFEPKTWKDADALLAGGSRQANSLGQGPLTPALSPSGGKGVGARGLKDVLVLGGNRSGKSEWAAKRCVQMLVNKAGSIVWCLSTTDKTSKRDQQKLIWKYLPPEWRALNRRKVGMARVGYDPKNGFTDGVLVGPNGSECHFMNYKQDRDVIEGGQVDLWWGDELIPVDWVVTLRGRTIDRHGQGLVTFTPIRGCSATVAEYITGAKVLEWTECELLPDQKLWPGGGNGQVPYRMECLNPEHAVIFFQSKWNPFIDYTELLKLWKTRSRSDILVRLHGVTDKRSGNVFPRYGTHNIIPHARIPAEGTNWHFGDFAWNRKWFMLWFRVWELKGKKRIFIYREWPDFETYGEWALPSEVPDGERGPAQETLGYSINDYKRLILTLEGHQLEGKREAAQRPEEIFQRYGDPRSGAVVSLQEQETTSIFDMLNNEGEGLPGLEVRPVAATGSRRFIGEGINLINQWLEYDAERELGVENEPMLYISERCRNVAECLKLWSGQGGEKGAAKDPIDLLRYAAVMDIDHYPPGTLQVTGGMG